MDKITQKKAACGIFPFPAKEGYTVSSGDKGDLVAIIKIIMNELCIIHDGYNQMNINFDYDKELYDAVIIFQNKNGLEKTGVVDKTTWSRLAEEYNLCVKGMGQ